MFSTFFCRLSNAQKLTKKITVLLQICYKFHTVSYVESVHIKVSLVS